MCTLQELLDENSRRRAKILSPYDPLKGSDPDKIDIERCRNDFEYWAATCCYIKNKEGGEDVLFRLNYPQRKLVAELERMRKANLPIRLILLKARQWGGSTCTQLYMAWLQMMVKSGLNSLIVAQQHTATAEIRDMFMRMLEYYPEQLLNPPEEDDDYPDENYHKRKGRRKKSRKITENVGPGTFRVIHANFKVKVGSAERPNSCRSGDYSLVHCSEVAMWKKTRLHSPEDMMRAATSGVLYKPLTMILLESTANGTDNFFHSEYEAAKKGVSQFSPLFIPWFDIEKYSLNFGPGEREYFAAMLLEGKDNRQPLNTRSQPGEYLWRLWEKGATLEAINWYVKERAKYSDHGQMASEYPSDDIEAFVQSGARVFDPYHVEKLKPGCELVPERGEITGDKPSGPDSLSNLRFGNDSQGALLIWKHPEVNPLEYVSDRYLVVVDIGGRSEKSDWSVIAVFDRLPHLEGLGPEIVAQWRGHTDFDLLAWNAARIAAYYSEALLVVESNTLETHERDRIVEGDQSNFLLNQLRQAYTNLYARRRKPEDIRQGAPLKYGFHTNVATKPLIISNLVKIVREGLYTERDPRCLNEFLTYEQRPDGSYGAVSDRHDDILMTRAIGLYISYNEMPLPRRTLISSQNDYYSPRRGSYASF